MYAIIQNGGKQYKVTEGEVVRLEKIEGDKGATLTLSEILMVGGNGTPKIGSPLISGASVTAEILRQAKDKKVLVFKKKRRKGYENKRGHRQLFTEVKISKINA